MTSSIRFTLSAAAVLAVSLFACSSAPEEGEETGTTEEALKVRYTGPAVSPSGSLDQEPAPVPPVGCRAPAYLCGDACCIPGGLYGTSLTICPSWAPYPRCSQLKCTCSQYPY